jgi:putative tricarboxylic transport membrane protein
MVALLPLSLVADSITALGILGDNLIWLFVGVIAGMALGIIPGMGGVVTLTIILPFTLKMDPNQAFIVLSAALGAVSFSGSISAILINAPGTGGNAATLMDGYPLAQKGKAAEAIGASATASAVGAVVGILFFFILIPFVIDVALLFGASEIFWLVLLGLSIVPLVSGERVLAGIALGGLGLLFAFVGQTSVTGEYRFTFDIPLLFDGIGLIPPLVGLFALAEMIKLAASDEGLVPDTVEEIAGSKFDGIREVIKHKWLFLRCSAIGMVVGAIPGIGATVATFISYGHAVQSSDNQEEFGSGRIEGVIATESANDSKDGGQLFPTLGLGIPGSASTAVLLGGFIIHGITPGPSLLQEELELMLVIVFALLFSNILTSVIGLIFTGTFIRIQRVSVSRLFPTIVILGLVATFVLRNNFGDMILALGFAAIGLVLMYLNITRIPIIIALILGSILERNFFLAMRLSDGGPLQAFFTGWLNQLLILILIASALLPLIQRMRGRSLLPDS